MLSSSLRRAVRTTASPSSSSAIVAFPKLLVPATTISNNAAGFASSQRRGAVRQQHQRRYSSSSKPPVPPNDGSRPIESQQTPANPSSAERKAKDNQGRKTAAGGAIGVGAVKSRQGSSTALLNLPSVPSTQHTPLEDINLASFFSVHRPISVSTSIPPTTNDAAFNAIFENKRRGNRSVDVINTLTSAVASMETAMHGGGRNQDQQLRNAVTQASASNAEPARIIHLDDVVVSEEDLHSSIAEFASRLTPFQPPAPPVPQEEEVVVNNLENADAAIDENANIRTYSTLLTIRETAYADGQRTFETSLAPLVPTNPEDNAAIIDEPALPTGAGKTYIERTVNRTMYTISVRRQRKLKMKKHKFKKLLRRTRTLRRKLDKA